MDCFLFSAPRPLDKVQIPKPSGSVTRLSRNGYSLEAALGWQDHELYVKVQVMSKPWSGRFALIVLKRFVQKQVNTHLQRHRPMCEQHQRELDIVCNRVGSMFHALSQEFNVFLQVNSEYEIMRRYEHHWATKDFIRIYLANAHHRR
jgi:hypothetical protein